MATKKNTPLSVETLKHEDATRKNIPTAEYQSVMKTEQQKPIPVRYSRERENRNCDLDPQLVWRGKDGQNWSDLIVHAPPLYIQEKVHPKVLIDDLKRQTELTQDSNEPQIDMFSDFNGLPNEDAKTEFYSHDAHWANRMILGDSLAVMASLAEREGLRGKVQCIYFDPPYGIKFNSNFQWSTTSRDVKDGSGEHITREPEQVKAFRDTWRDGIHSYLTYLQDRLVVARDLLGQSGSVFVQIGDENLHRVRNLLDEVFGEKNFKSVIQFVSNSGLAQAEGLATVGDYVLWYAKDAAAVKFRKLYLDRPNTDASAAAYSMIQTPEGERRSMSKQEKSGAGVPEGSRRYRYMDISKPGPGSKYEINFEGRVFNPGKRWWGTTPDGISRLHKANRLAATASTLWQVKFYDDFPYTPLTNHWSDTASSFASDKIYVVQTNTKIVQRCILMTTDPGDIVLDPTCGSGTTAYVSEEWGRRWITIDTSRVALALARGRIMGARYPFYLLADSIDGKRKEAEITRSTLSTNACNNSIRQGFVYERASHITMASIVGNSEIDVIWDRYSASIENLRSRLNAAIGESLEPWQVPLNPPSKWSKEAREIHSKWISETKARRCDIDASINAKAGYQALVDRPYSDDSKVRVAGPFTVESLSPHRVLGVDENDELIDPNDPKVAEQQAEYNAARSFVQIILENLKTAGVQQAHKEDKVVFTSLVPWPGDLVCGEGLYEDSTGEKRAAIFIGPEFGTVSRPDLVSAAREAGDAGFDVLIACAFNYDAHSSEFEKLGRIPVLKARMNADLHMAEDLKNTGKGNLFVIFGEPDIDILDAAEGQVCVKVNGVDVFHPNTGEVRSDGADGIACWLIDTDYNEESFFVRHAYFLGANDPYKALKTTLKAEINEDAWATLNSDTSRPFDKPKSGRIAVKVINHLGDEVMKVFKV